MKRMHITRRSLALLLSLVLIALSCPLSVFAEGDPITLQTYTLTNGTWVADENCATYASIDAAITALDTLYDGVSGNTTQEIYDNAGRPVIKLTSDVTTTTAHRIPWRSQFTTDQTGKMRTVVIDGAKENGEGNYTLTGNTNGYFFNDLAACNYEFRNLTINVNASAGDGMFSHRGRDCSYVSETFTTFTNVILNANQTGGGGSLFKTDGKLAPSSGVDPYPHQDIFNITFNNSTVNDTNEIGMQVCWGADANIDLNNSTWTNSSNGSDGSNHPILKAYNCGDIRINLDGTSALISARKQGSTKASVFECQSTIASACTYEVTLQSGALIWMKDETTLTGGAYFCVAGSGDKTVVYDQGAIWKAGSASSAANTLNLPTSVVKGDFPVAWHVNGTALTSSVYNLPAATEITFTGVSTDPKDNPANVAYIDGGDGEDQFFTTLVSAIAKAKDGDVIHLLRDVEEDINTVVPPSGIRITIDGTKATDSQNRVTDVYHLNSTSGGYLFEVGSTNLTLQNMKITTHRGLRFHGITTGSFETTLKNVEMNVYGGIAFKIGQTYKPEEVTAGVYRDFKLNFIDSHVTGAGPDTMFAIFHPARFVINVQNSTLEHTNGLSGDNQYMFNTLANGGGSFTVDGSSVLKSASTSTSGNTAGIFRLQSSCADVSITLAKGATLLLATSVSNKTNNVFLSSSIGDRLTLTDNGAVWKAEAATAKLGVTLPSLGNEGSWYVGTTPVALNYKDTSATSDVIFTKGAALDPMENPSNVAYVEGNGTKTYYTSLSEAVNAVIKGNSPVIHLIRDLTVSDVIVPSWLGEYDPANMRTVKIDGLKTDGTRVTVTVSGAFFTNLAYYNLELSNLNVTVCAEGVDGIFNWEAQISKGNAQRNAQTQTTKLTNCTFTPSENNKMDSGAGGNFFKMKGNGKDGTAYAGDFDVFTLIMKNCELTENAGNILIVHHGTSANITVEDTVIKHIGGSPDGSNTSIFKFFDCDGVTLEIIGASVLESALPLDPDAKIDPDTNTSNANFTSTNMIHWMSSVDQAATHKLILGKEVVLYLNSAADKTTNKWINNAIGAKLEVVDAGASYKASPTMLKNGVTLPSLAHRAGTALGWSNGTVLVSKGDSVYRMTSTEDVSFTAVVLSDSSFSMLTGASIRTSAPYGIRFEVELSEALYELLGSGFTLNMWIMPAEFLGNSSFIKGSLFTGEYITIELTDENITERRDGKVVFAGDLLGIPATAGGVTMEFTARAFLAVEYEGGTVDYIYSDYNKADNTRSLADVAEAMYKAGITDNAVVNEILALASKEQ